MRKYLYLSVLLFIFFCGINSYAQAPVWQNGTPSVNPLPVRLELTINLDIGCNVYYSVFPYSVGFTPSPSTAIDWAKSLKEKGIAEEYLIGPTTLEDAYVKMVGRLDVLETAREKQ